MTQYNKIRKREIITKGERIMFALDLETLMFKYEQDLLRREIG